MRLFQNGSFGTASLVKKKLTEPPSGGRKKTDPSARNIFKSGF
jgi:hypothetical protein